MDSTKTRSVNARSYLIWLIAMNKVYVALWATTIITDTSNSLISISDKHAKHFF